jgi:hypothetical protein
LSAPRQYAGEVSDEQYEGDVMLLKWTLIKRITPRWRMQFFALAMAICLSQAACGACNAGFRNAPAKLPNEAANKRVDNMRISIKVGNETVTATLVDSETTRDFVSQLPLTLTLKDYAATEKISDLPKRLSTEGAPSGSDPSVGDIAFYAPWGNLAIFYRDAEYANGLIILGKIDGDAAAFNVPGSMKVTIESVK